MANDATPAPDAQPPTPSETLRQAAALVRERAEAATPGPWEYVHAGLVCETRTEHGDCLLEYGIRASDAKHAASWHPAVALLVALAFEQHVDVHDSYDCVHEPCAHVLAARAYLGEA